MKLRSLFFGALACITMASCSSDDDSTAAESKDKSYVSVRLTMPGNTTRAWDTANNDDSYAEAPKDELVVKDAVFFFFNEFNEGVADATLIDGKDLTWDHGTTGTVDDQSSAVIVLDTRTDPSHPDPLQLPTKVVVVLNPTAKILADKRPDLSELQTIIENYQYKEPPFMMSSSVYAKDGKIVATTDISNNVFNNVDDALNSPVKIPVEKVVAKISTIYSKSEGETFPLFIDNAPTATDVKVKLYKEWWIDNTQQKAYMLKNLSPSYTESGSIAKKDWWNDITNTRSYWANTTPYDAATFGHYAFNTKSGKDQFCLEHTSAPNIEDSASQTKVVFAGQIVNAATNAPIDLIKYAGFHYTGEGLKNFLAKQGVVRKYYKKKASETTYTQLNASDIEYICNADGNILTYKSISGDESLLKDYHVMVSLKADSEYDYYTSVDEEPNPSSPTATTAAAIAQEWQSRFGELKYWKNGNTYFFTEIKHHSESSFANYGIVRNHLYKLTVNSLAGMGTPVPNEEKTIIPERPEGDKESYISAEIQILKYRIVEQSVDLH